METTGGQTYVSVGELLEALDGLLSKNTVYRAIADGIIPSIRIRWRILVPRDALDRMLKVQTDEPV